MTRAALCDQILTKLFRIGQPPPTRKQLVDAYPFGIRAYSPYKTWLRHVRAFREAHAKATARVP